MIKLNFIFIINLSPANSTPSESCKTDSECLTLNYCNLDLNKCLHKAIFSDVKNEIIGLICIVFGSALSNAGGIGGGGLLIPILLLILNFYTHEAIPISKLMIFTGALTSFFLGFRQKHPTRNSITIEYNIPYLLVPMLLFGTMVGVTLNKVTPPWLILVSLTLVLIINTYKTMKKAKSLYEAENKKRRLSGDTNDMRVLSNLEENKNERKNENQDLVSNEVSAANTSTSNSASINNYKNINCKIIIL